MDLRGQPHEFGGEVEVIVTVVEVRFPSILLFALGSKQKSRPTFGRLNCVFVFKEEDPVHLFSGLTNPYCTVCSIEAELLATFELP